jgi:hypothetical protein
VTPGLNRGDDTRAARRALQRSNNAVAKQRATGPVAKQKARERLKDKGGPTLAGRGDDNVRGKLGRKDGPNRAALVKQGKGDRRWVLRNRGLAGPLARDPAARALARATFGGKFAKRWDRDDWRRWRHRHRHKIIVIGWIGPVFWPYAYDDFIDYTFWPYAYDAFWPYAYDEVYDGFFGPYAVGGPVYASRATANAPGRSTGRTRAVARGAGGAHLFTAEASGLTDWPIARIVEAVEPDATQRAALDALQSAAAEAVAVLRAACPDALPSTPTGRLAAMRARLESMRKAVHIVQPALAKFYDSLSDEQKARFDALDPEESKQAAKGKAELTQVCSAEAARASLTPVEKIEQAIRPNAQQRAALEGLGQASAKAAEVLAANCPSDEALTPPGRLAAMGQRLDAMLQALDIVQPALERFYSSLNNEQRARFNQLGAREQASR